MRRLRALILMAALPLLIAGCGQSLVHNYYAKNYEWHKQTNWIKVHWDLGRPDDKTVVAEGFVEPFSPRNGVFGVQLNLVGLDADGKVVNSVSGRPADYNIVSPFDKSPFAIKMELNGQEKSFTITGSYYHFATGARLSLDPQYLDNIPLQSNEPYE